MDWSQVTSLTIPEGNVTQVAIGDVVLWKKSLLPVGYTQLEYIASNGTQYIDTGFTFDDTTKAHFVFEKTGDNIGQLTSGRATAFFGANHSNNSQACILGWNNINYVRGGMGTFAPALNTKTDVVVDYTSGNASLIINDISYGHTTGTGLIGKSVLLFAILGNTGPQTVPVTFNQQKIYAFELWNGEALVCKLIPAMRDSDGEVGMYDTISKTFLTNAGTGEFIAGHILPSEYTLLDYVQSTGQQWFSTGKVLEQTKNYSVEISFSELTNLNHSLFGAQNGQTRTYCTYNGQVYCGTGTNRLIYSNKINTTDSFVLRCNWNGSNNNLDVYVNNAKINSGVQSGSFADKELYFLSIIGGSGFVSASCKTYYFKITEDDEVIRYYIPCRRNSDGKVGMYDLITKEFKSSITTTDFIASDDTQSINLYEEQEEI